MKDRISEDTIEYVGILAKLQLSEQEKLKARADMEQMLEYIDILNELDTSETEPMYHLFPANNVFREDVKDRRDGSEEALANAPLAKEQYFKVPRTIG